MLLGAFIGMVCKRKLIVDTGHTFWRIKMKYNVYVQSQLVGTVEAKNTGDALAKVGEKIAKQEFVLPNQNELPNIKLEPVNE